MLSFDARLALPDGIDKREFGSYRLLAPAVVLPLVYDKPYENTLLRLEDGRETVIAYIVSGDKVNGEGKVICKPRYTHYHTAFGGVVSLTPCFPIHSNMDFPEAYDWCVNISERYLEHCFKELVGGAAHGK